MARKQRVRVVVVGNSYAAYCQIPGLRWASAHGDVDADVVAIVGKNAAKAQATAAQAGIPLATTSLAHALEQRPDLVLVATPVDLHAAQVEQALLTTPAAVLCEKPFTLAVDDARRLAALAHGRLALVDHQLRWSAPRRKLREIVVGGAIGAPWVARAEMCFGSVARFTRAWTWWDDARRGGGVMQAIGSHLVDGLLWTLGPVVDVQGRLTTCVQSRPVADGAEVFGHQDATNTPSPPPAARSTQQQHVTADDHCEMWLTHASGARSSVLCSVVHAHGRRSLFEVVGERGIVRLVDEDALYVGRHDGALERVPVSPPSVAEVEASNDSAFARSEPLFLRSLLAGVAAGARALDDAATFDDGLRNVQVLAACR